MIIVQPDGKIVMGGSSFEPLHRFRSDGKLDAPYARFDFDGDERTDLSVFRPSDRTWFIHTGQAFTSFHFGEPTDLPAAARCRRRREDGFRGVPPGERHMVLDKLFDLHL